VVRYPGQCCNAEFHMLRFNDSSASAGAIASFLTSPLDLAKLRMQVCMSVYLSISIFSDIMTCLID
jgi:hypothetical protein